MDVVSVRAADWTTAPIELLERDGGYYGCGVFALGRVPVVAFRVNHAVFSFKTLIHDLLRRYVLYLAPSVLVLGKSLVERTAHSLDVQDCFSVRRDSGLFERHATFRCWNDAITA